MELKKIATGWIKHPLEVLPPGEWILIADGHTDYYDWYVAQGTQQAVEAAYIAQGGTIAKTYIVTDGKAEMVRPERAICPKCKIWTNKKSMVSGVCFFCEIEAKAKE